MTFVIDTARSDDVTELRRVILASWQAAYDSIYPPHVVQRILERTFSTRSLTRALLNDTAGCLVAREKGVLVGCCHFGSPLFDDCETRKELYYIYVVPSSWRQGIGTTLLQEASERVRHQHISELFCYVHPQNEAALSFFGARGFVHVADEDKDGEKFLRRVL